MAIVLPADLDVFFDAEGFGEAVSYRHPDGAVIPAVALWDRADVRARFGEGDVALATNFFTLRDDVTGEPLAGGEVTVTATGQVFVLKGVAERCLDGAYWRIAGVAG